MNEIIDCMKFGINGIVSIIDERITLIANDLIQPLDMYINHHNETFHTQFDQAK